MNMRLSGRARVPLGAIVLAAGFYGMWVPTQAVAADCTLETVEILAPSDTTITAATPVTAGDGLPAYCRVDGFVSTPGNEVNFRLGLPDAWNGKYLHLGNGGFAGSIGALNAGLTRGYATASTDTGHQASGVEAGWALNNPAKVTDWAYRGLHSVVVSAKAITQGYYGRTLDQAYFSGCSGGGRQALIEAQRFPNDFNGIIAGAPALNWTGFTLGFNWDMQALLASLEAYVPASKVPVLSRAAVAACDAKDGLTDGLIDDPRRCRFDPAVLTCEGGDGPDCLTPAQVETVKKIYAGPSTSTGEQIFPGFPPGHEEGPGGWSIWITGFEPPTPRPDGQLTFPVLGLPLQMPFSDQTMRFLAFNNPDYDPLALDFDTDARFVISTLGPLLDATDPDLSPFIARGGKLIIYHGWADHALTAYMSLDYYEDVLRTVDGKPNALGTVKSQDAVRLFMMPGMHHCSGGPGINAADWLTTLEQWVEAGNAPDRVLGSSVQAGEVTRTRPLCPYPQVARYTGSGSIDEAENFVCTLKGLDRAAEAAGFDHGSRGRDRARGR